MAVGNRSVFPLDCGNSINHNWYNSCGIQLNQYIKDGNKHQAQQRSGVFCFKDDGYVWIAWEINRS